MTTDDAIDYSEIRDDRIRTKICQLMSEMLDNPDDCGIYPTGKFMWEMETFILSEKDQQQAEIKELRGKLERISMRRQIG